MDGEIRKLQEVIHLGKLENVALSGRVRDLEHNVSVGTSHHRDVSKGIDRLHEALLSLGDSITTNIGVVNTNTKCINDALHVVREDTSDIRRVVHDLSATHLAHPMPSVDLAPQAVSPSPSRTYLWSDRGVGNPSGLCGPVCPRV